MATHPGGDFYPTAEHQTPDDDETAEAVPRPEDEAMGRAGAGVVPRHVEAPPRPA